MRYLRRLWRIGRLAVHAASVWGVGCDADEFVRWFYHFYGKAIEDIRKGK